MLAVSEREEEEGGRLMLQIGLGAALVMAVSIGLLVWFG